MKRSPLSFATHVSWPVSSRQHHQMCRLTDEKSRPSEPGRRVIGVTRWKGCFAVCRTRSLIAVAISSVGLLHRHHIACDTGRVLQTLNEPGKCSACRALAPPSVGWGFFSDRPKLLVSAILLSSSRRSLLRWWHARDGIPVLIIDCE